MKVLIIEDDQGIVESISLALNIRWPDIKIISTHLGNTGVELAESEQPDLIMLDLGLPDISGFDILKQIRLFSSVPIIILTVRPDESDVVKGLEWGADDYIIKPCGQLELLARVKVRLRDRERFIDQQTLSHGTLRFDPTTHQLIQGDKEIKLTAIESQIVHLLIRNSGRVATYHSLTEEIWGEDYPGSVESLRVHIRRLREKMETDPSHPRYILTKASVGYSLAKPD